MLPVCLLHCNDVLTHGCISNSYRAMIIMLLPLYKFVIQAHQTYACVSGNSLYHGSWYAMIIKWFCYIISSWLYHGNTIILYNDNGALSSSHTSHSVQTMFYSTLSQVRRCTRNTQWEQYASSCCKSVFCIFVLSAHDIVDCELAIV